MVTYMFLFFFLAVVGKVVGPCHVSCVGMGMNRY